MLISLGLVGLVQAIDTPSFPTCTSPIGNLVVQYSDGIHGIVGSSSVYTGSDSVYQVSDNTLIQCFCPSDGQGIQTNWLKADLLTSDQITQLKSDGWILIPNGALWGLDSVPYLAQNINFSCQSSSNSSSSSSSNSSSTNSSGGVDLGIGGAVGQVLGLAATGNSLIFYSVGVISLLLLLTSFSILRRYRG